MNCQTPQLSFKSLPAPIFTGTSLIPTFFTFIFFFAAQQSHAALADMSRIFRQTPSLQAFEVCFGGGCAETRQVDLTLKEWQKIVDLFEAIKPVDPAQERAAIAQAIGLLESIVGEKIGTSGDLAGTFFDGKLTGQMDCNDESINTTTYIRLMQQNGLIQWHAVEDTRTRKFFFTGWPHSTAVIHDIGTGERFAVDSWFYDNGAPATIVPFATWKAGYRPADSPIDHARVPVASTPAK